MNELVGTGVALVTPFKEDFSVDFEALQNLLNHTTEGGVDYFVVMGTTAETATVSKEEKKQILSFVKEKSPVKIPIVYGIGGNNTQELISELKETELNDVSAILSVSPYYNKPSQEGLYQHYMKLADSSPVPIILYNVPGRTGMNMTAQTTARLSAHPNIIGVKEASGDLVQCIEIKKNTPDDFMLIAGDDLLAVPIISIGGNGSIAVLANLFPKDFSDMVRLSINGDFTKASEILRKFTQINPLMYAEGNPVGAKCALSELGLIKNVVRQPLYPASKSLQLLIKEALSEFL
ncbi:MAG: 4-hydroxy-tetrahydrodipicolinate synthase [Cytophagales bacterium]